jgi:hypothetical protein
VGHRGGTDVLENRKHFPLPRIEPYFSVKPGADKATTIPFYTKKTTKLINYY